MADRNIRRLLLTLWKTAGAAKPGTPEREEAERLAKWFDVIYGCERRTEAALGWGLIVVEVIVALVVDLTMSFGLTSIGTGWLTAVVALLAVLNALIFHLAGRWLSGTGLGRWLFGWIFAWYEQDQVLPDALREVIFERRASASE